jgi:hypothetical protein
MNYTRNKNFLHIRELYKNLNNNNNNNNATVKSVYRDCSKILSMVIKKGKKEWNMKN